jgi:hypothetical protein
MKQSSYSQTTKFPRILLFCFFLTIIPILFFCLKENKIDWVLFLILFCIVLILNLFSCKIEISNYELKYNLFPLIFNKTIKWDDVVKVELIRLNALYDFLGWGLRYSIKYGWGYIFEGDYGLFISTKNGRKVVFSIRNIDELSTFLEKNQIDFIKKI